MHEPGRLELYTICIYLNKNLLTKVGVAAACPKGLKEGKKKLGGASEGARQTEKQQNDNRLAGEG